MVLEAAFLVVDNSNYMRNGDFAPSRMDAQLDAVNLLSGAKTQSNPENTVGLLSTAGKGVEVHVALTSDVGKILSLSHGIKLGGESNLTAGIQVAQLSLKHRQNKNQRQRIIVFVGSPVKEDESTLVKLGKKLKKNSVAVDIINFGEEAENAAKLEALLNAVNSDDNSHLVTVPPGPHVLSDILLSSPIVQGEDGAAAAVAAAAAAGGGGGDGFTEFGVDPNMDPEFAYALRISMEEERARQEAEAAKAATSTDGAPASAAEGEAAAADASAEPAPAAGAEPGSAASAGADVPMADAGEGADVDEDALLEAALAMSMPGTGATAGGASGTAGSAQESATPAAAAPMETPQSNVQEVEMADADEDEAMQLALAMSMSQAAETSAASAPAAPAPPESDLSSVLRDAGFLQSVLGSLPGVDTSDPRIQSVLNSASAADEKKDDKGADESEKK